MPSRNSSPILGALAAPSSAAAHTGRGESGLQTGPRHCGSRWGRLGHLRRSPSCRSWGGHGGTLCGAASGGPRGRRKPTSVGVRRAQLPGGTPTPNPRGQHPRGREKAPQTQGLYARGAEPPALGGQAPGSRRPRRWPPAPGQSKYWVPCSGHPALAGGSRGPRHRPSAYIRRGSAAAVVLTALREGMSPSSPSVLLRA